VSIVAQTDLIADRYKIFEALDPDAMSLCFDAVTQAFDEALRRDAQAEIIADYTGGTKTMSAALTRAATGRYAAHAKLSVVTGQRDNLRAVQDGTESAWVQETASFRMEEQWHLALGLANQYHYASADTLLGAITGYPVAPALRRKTQALIDLCRGLDAWDRFDHDRALNLLRAHGRLLGERLKDLGSLVKNGTAPPTWGVASVLPVYDLLLNAERRAAQGRYDDAVARLYRALEMLAQNRLRGAYGIAASDVDRAKAPESWLAQQGFLNDDSGSAPPPSAGDTAPKLRIGLRQSYELLLALDDAMGHVFCTHERRLRDMLERRNQSILAHGTRSIAAEEYSALQETVSSFAQEAVAATGLKMRRPTQFPHLTPDQFDS
jgi:CRISPR-associated protein (TIGR02710 family)